LSLNAAALRLLAEKGLSALDIVEVAEAMEVRVDRTAAVRQQRRRDKVKAEARDESRRDVTRDALPIDSILTLPDPQSPDGDCPPLAERVVLAWNAGPAAKGARKAVAMDQARRKALAARVREHGETAVFDAIGNLAASRFHCGENDRNWRANLGWMLEPKHFLKALEMEGRPANGTATAPVSAEARADLDRRIAARAEIEARWERGEFASRADYHREMDRVRDGGDPPRRTSTGPTRSIGALASTIAQQNRAGSMTPNPMNTTTTAEERAA
jgi:hypothetical protein